MHGLIHRKDESVSRAIRRRSVPVSIQWLRYAAYVLGALVCTLPACRRADEPVAATKSVASTGVLGGQARFGLLDGYNLLLVTIDTLRRDHLGCYGFADADTPNIDRLAERGVLFEHAVTASPSTLPSHCTMMTGLELPHHGVRTNGKFTLDEKVTTLAEVLKTRGYKTAAFVGTFVLNAKFGLAQGFDHYSDTWWLEGETIRTAGPRRAAMVTDSVVEWINENRDNIDGPFFIWAHYFDPHQKYDPPEPYATRFADSLYDGEIAYADEHIGRLLAFLVERNLTERTLVVLLSDHGEGLGEHGEEDHSRLIYDTTMRIPLIFSCPGKLESGVRVDDVTVGTIDLMPTVLSLLGETPPDRVDGIDLATQRVPGDRSIYLETLAPLLYHGWSGLHGLRRIDSKFILAPLPETYDLMQDPKELNNLYEDDRRAGRDLLADLTELMEDWPDDEDALGEVAEMDPMTARRLASLGYVSSGTDGAHDGTRPDPKDYVPIYDFLYGARDPEAYARVRRTVLKPDETSGAYRQALVLADLLCERHADDDAYHAARGMALFRVGRDEDALAALRVARSLRAERGQPRLPGRLAFEAMALHRLDRKEKAQDRLSQLREHVDHSGSLDDPDLAALIAEARALVRSP